LFAFITSLIHPLNCQSYARVGDLLDRALRSVCGQTRDDFVVLVVGNEKPRLRFSDPRINFVQVQYPPAGPKRGQVASRDRRRFDKGTKLAAGLLYARARNPQYVMFFDYDDLVHRGIAAYVKKYPGADAWEINVGYVYWEGSSRITLVRGFSGLCGTSNVLSFRLLDCPASLTPQSSQQEIVGVLGQRYVECVLGAHSHILGHFRAKGCSIASLPFPGAVWIRGTGENASLSRGFPSLLGRRITPDIQRDFGLDPPHSTFFRELTASTRQTALSWRQAKQTAGVSRAVSQVLLRAPRRLWDSIAGRPRGV
jgi:hypothetical protein